MHEKLTLHQILLVLGMLVTGSINSLSSKTQFQTKSEGLPDSDGKTFRPFNHAGIATLIMFAGESLCLLGFCFSSRKVELSNKQLDIDQDSSDVIKQNRKKKRILYLIFILPAACDVIGSTLSALAMIHLDASVAQMLGGSIIVFTGILSKIFLKHRLKASHWFGIVVKVSGLCLVGLASILKSESGNQSQKYVAIGIVLTILSQFASATQMVLEEIFLKGKGFKPYHVVGMEGVYGFFLMSEKQPVEEKLENILYFLVTPYLISDCFQQLLEIVLVVMQYVPGPQPGNSFDNTYDALIMIKNSSTLTALSLVYLLSIAFFNYFGLSVTRSMTAVHRIFIDSCRSVIIWLCSIIVYHLTNGNYGEKFGDNYGLLQIDGFLLLLTGTAIYNQLIDFSWIPCVKSIEHKIHSNAQQSKVTNSDYEKCNAADNETYEHNGFSDD